MTYYRAVFAGAFGGGDEFQFGLGIDDVGLSSTEDVADAMGSAFAESESFFESLIMPNDRYNLLTVYRWAVIGGPATEVAERPLSLVGTGTGTQSLPNQCALVVSLRTGNPGRSKRGRVFLPLRNAGAMNQLGLLDQTITQQWADGFADFLGKFNNSLSGRRVAVLSKTLQDSFNVTSVDVGNVVDTQRRRRNGQIESRASAEVLPL